MLCAIKSVKLLTSKIADAVTDSISITRAKVEKADEKVAEVAPVAVEAEKVETPEAPSETKEEVK